MGGMPRLMIIHSCNCWIFNLFLSYNVFDSFFLLWRHVVPMRASCHCESCWHPANMKALQQKAKCGHCCQLSHDDQHLHWKMPEEDRQHYETTHTTHRLFVSLPLKTIHVQTTRLMNSYYPKLSDDSCSSVLICFWATSFLYGLVTAFPFFSTSTICVSILFVFINCFFNGHYAVSIVQICLRSCLQGPPLMWDH